MCFTRHNIKPRALWDVARVALMSGNVITVIIVVIIPGSQSVASLSSSEAKAKERKIYVLLRSSESRLEMTDDSHRAVPPA